MLRAQVNREGIDWTEHHRRGPDRYGALRITEEGFCSSWSFIAADVGPIKATGRVRLALSVGGMSCVAPAMQAVATSVASRLFHPDGFANNPSNPQTPLTGGSYLFTIAKGLQTVWGERSTAQTNSDFSDSSAAAGVARA